MLTDNERETLAEVLDAHSNITYDMGTPREYTGHGEWNQSCGCGHLYGSQAAVDAGWGKHLADVALAHLDLAAREGEWRAPIEALAADGLWRTTPCGCGHRADLHTNGALDPAICTGGLGLCGCSWSFPRIVEHRLRAALGSVSAPGNEAGL